MRRLKVDRFDGTMVIFIDKEKKYFAIERSEIPFELKCYSPPMLSTNRHRILSIRYWLCQPIGILFCQRNEMLLRKTKAINPITNLAHKQIAASSRFESG